MSEGSSNKAIPTPSLISGNTPQRHDDVLPPALTGGMCVNEDAALAKVGCGHNDLEPLFYTMFINVSIMIFSGFGFLMSLLRRYGYSSVGLVVTTSAVVIQLSLVMSGLYKSWAFEWGRDLNLKTLLYGLFCAAAVQASAHFALLAR